ncbi:hypothetical protein HELRODRAFT_82671 [Helobdella robusta]|uniref:Uncharacterized protein n=1 Tax=Helobdella robusta TaxID=6412 RepID=T1G4V1_HELRO|nr:hypothetical protein HELRODRAFT_82671 [Helobdella robusta]ESO00915.1 hypothetical protein HELRODRAFT_82671 [Helobdella robusta]
MCVTADDVSINKTFTSSSSSSLLSSSPQPEDSLDTDFDAGRESTSGVISSTLVSYWTWAATLLQSTTVTVMYGISGAYWYAAGATIQILLFSIIIVMLKVKAPGAKTYLQVIRARFDRATHLTFCVFALVTNFVVTAMLMLGGATVLTNMIKGLSIEMGTLLVVGTIFIYTFTGGLSATMYVSYFNTAVMLLLVLVFLYKVFYAAQTGGHGSGVDSVYDTLICFKVNQAGNMADSHLTMYSARGLIFGIINIVGNFGAVFVDQSYWQCGVAAKPFSAVAGFLLGGLTWFTIPLTFGTTMGLAYRAIQVLDRNVTTMWRGLDDDSVKKGLVAPYVANRLMGTSGNLMCVILVVMAITSTGASQIIAVTSVLVYDVYQLYLKVGGAWVILLNFVIFTIAILPLTIVMYYLSVSLNWVYSFMGILIGSAVPPIILSLTWSRLTGRGMSFGVVGGTSCGLVVWLMYAGLKNGGLSDFFESTETSMLAGNLASIISGAVITVVTSVVLNRSNNDEKNRETWEMTRDIDNPLRPWTELYSKELNLAPTEQLDSRPSLEAMESKYRRAKHLAIIFSAIFTILLVLVWPALMLISEVMDRKSFTLWVNFFNDFTFF